MRTTFSICLCKLVTFICHIFKKEGSVYPGGIINKFDKKILNYIKYPSKVIVVTGSSGKGSTVSMIAHILKNANYNVVWNKSGSNVKNAITTLILNNTGIISHKVKADVVLLEMDERYIKSTFGKGIISHLLITNITRDQPTRNVHVDFIFNTILSSIDKNTHLIINDDDPILNRVKYLHHGKITTFGIGETVYSSKCMPSYPLDAAYCPKCNTKLKYKYYHYGHLGSYECPNCDFKRGKVDYELNELNLDNGTAKINDIKYNLNKKVFFAAYHVIASYTLAKVINIDDEIIKKTFSDEKIENKTFHNFSIANRELEILDAKNENALSFTQSLNYVVNQKGPKTVILGFNIVSRRYPFCDLSWLWDINFELLNDSSIDKIICLGKFKYDIATRLEYANISEDKIILIDNENTLLNEIENKTKGNIYALVYYDMLDLILKLIKESQNEENN